MRIGKGSCARWLLAALGMLVACADLAAEEKSNPVVTALGGTTFSGYVDTAATWRWGNTLPPPIQPIELPGLAGLGVSFSIANCTNTDAVFQWFFNDQPLAGCTNTSLSMTNLSQAHAGLYSFFSTNSTGDVSYALARLTVFPLIAPTTTNQLATPAFSANKLCATFVGVPGTAYVFERTSDLTTWLPLATNTAPSDGCLLFLDPTPPAEAASYRTRALAAP